VEVSPPQFQFTSNFDTYPNARKHVLSDLQPYVCTHLECSLHEHLFEDREDWWQHKTQSHRPELFEWFCNTGLHQTFQEASDFISHMNDYHDEVIRESQLPALKHIFRHPKLSQGGACNLCGTVTAKLKLHIAKHLQQLALFTIPRTDYVNLSDTEDAQLDKAHGSRDSVGDYSLPSTVTSSPAQSQDLFARAAMPQSPVVPNSDVAFSEGELKLKSFQEGTQAITQMPDEPPPDTIVSGEGYDTSWDFATPKFREARVAMYGTKPPDLLSIQPSLPKEDPSDQNEEPKLTGAIVEPALMHPYYQERPICGASIGAYRGEHLPPVSLGGIIMVDGKPFGLTVHHMLDAPRDDISDKQPETHDESTVRDPLSVEGRKKGNERAGNKPEVLWEQERPDDALGNLKDEAMQDAVRTMSIDTAGDIPGISFREGDHIKVTQPAFDNVEDDFFPNKDDRDEEHLMSHELGHIHASSGIRRWRYEGILHEMDWALINIKPDRLQPWNIVRGGQRFRTSKDIIQPPIKEPMHVEDEFPMEVADADSLGGLDVHCFGRTTGLRNGKIDPKMSMVKFHRRKNSSISWTVKGDSKTIPALRKAQIANMQPSRPGRRFRRMGNRRPRARLWYSAIYTGSCGIYTAHAGCA
jgi:hypothetical protein